MSDPSEQRSSGVSQLGEFELLEKIGEGGMGAVYRARQQSLDRIVALKVLTPKLTSDTAYIHSFLREARAAGRLNHPSIVHIYSVGETEGLYYYAMEFVRGETLHHWVQQNGALPETMVLSIGQCTANALKHAWNKEQIIHRDIKPDNIMVDTDGNVKVCDLGLAKSFGESTTLSLSGQVFGTPQYMSPEQARAERNVDCRADIYALGMTLYYALTAQIPFHGGAPALVMMRQLTEQLPDPREVNPTITPHTVRVLEKMVSKNIEHRYQSWDEVSRDLQLVSAGQPPQCLPPPHGTSSLRRAHPVGGTGVSPAHQNVVGTAEAERRRNAESRANRRAVRTSQPSGAPSGRALPQKSRAPLFIGAGIAVVTVLLGTVLMFTYRASNPNPTPPEVGQPIAPPQNPKPQNPPPQNPIVNPPPPVLTAAALALREADQFAAANAANSDRWQDITARFQQVARQFPNEKEAALASRAALEWEDKWRVEDTRRKKEAEEQRQQEEAARRLAEQLEREKKEAEQRGKAFTDFQEKLLDHLKNRRYADAEKLAQDKLADASLRDFHPVIAAWRDAAQRAGRFWSALPDEAQNLNKDREVTLQNVKGFVAKVTREQIEFDKLPPEDRKQGQTIGVGEIRFSDLTPDSVLVLLDLLNAGGQLRADAAWFCFAEQKYTLALARVDAPDREKMSRLERDSREIVKQQRIARLLATAKANDNKQNGKFALTALTELLQLDPQHEEARELYAKIAAYYDENFTNTIGMAMVWIPKNGVNGGYYVGKYEVTQAEYQKVMGNNPSIFKGYDRRPVEQVSWDDAMAFCKKLTELERAAGRLREGWIYMLPTEKQWEYFVGNADLKDAVTSKARNRNSTEPVGSLGPNNFGLHDVRGNVWEWCADWYDDRKQFRVLRGASWGYNFPGDLAVSFRSNRTPDSRNSYCGFRVVLVAVGAASSSR